MSLIWLKIRNDDKDEIPNSNKDNENYYVDKKDLYQIF